MERREIRRARGPVDHAAAVELIGQDLQDRAGLRIPLVHFPEQRRSAAIGAIVAVVNRPHPVARRTEDVAFDDPESEADHDVEVGLLDARDILVLEPVDELRAQGRHHHHVRASQEGREIDDRERILAFVAKTPVVGRLVPFP